MHSAAQVTLKWYSCFPVLGAGEGRVGGLSGTSGTYHQHEETNKQKKDKNKTETKTKPKKIKERKKNTLF